MSDEVGPVEQRYAAFWKRLGPSAATLQESREWRSQIDAELKALGFSGFDLGKILDIIEADAKLNGQDASHYGRLDKFDDILHEIRTWVELQRFKTRNAQTVDDGETLVTIQCIRTRFRVASSPTLLHERTFRREAEKPDFPKPATLDGKTRRWRLREVIAYFSGTKFKYVGHVRTRSDT
jgi:hypothetical protein